MVFQQVQTKKGISKWSYECSIRVIAKGLPRSGDSSNVLKSHDIQNGQLLGEEFPTKQNYDSITL